MPGRRGAIGENNPTWDYFDDLASGILHTGFREHLPTFMCVVQLHILDGAQGERGWLKNTSPFEMAVEESPLGPL